jgi:uncharacterized protein YycO
MAAHRLTSMMMNLSTIKLRFVKGKGFASEAICAVTWSRWSHVEFALPNGYLGCQVNGGVALRKLNYDQVILEDFFNVSVTEKQKIDIFNFAYKQLGKPYDFSALVGILAHRDWHSEDSWFCSELVAAAFEAGGKPLLLNIENVDRITPGMLATSPLLIPC